MEKITTSNGKHHVTFSEDVMAAAACSGDELSDSFTKEFMSCSICWEPYDDRYRQPKLLSCHHTFCKSCIKKLLRGKSIVQCSTCRKETMVLTGVSKLQTNFYVMYLKQKMGEQQKNQQNVCQKHAMQPLSFFCKTCVEMVCRDCIVLAHAKSEGHDLQEVTAVKAEYELSLESLRVEVEDAIQQRKTQLRSLRVELDTMDIVRDNMMIEADRVFSRMIDIVNARKQQVKEMLKDTHESKHRAINEQLVEIDNQTTQLVAILDHLDDVTCKGNVRDILDVATDRELQSRIEVLSAPPSITVGRNYFKLINNDVEKLLKECLQTAGEIKDVCELPSQIRIETKKATASQKTDITITVKTFTNEPVISYPISLDIIDPSGDEIPCQLTDNRDGTYSVEFRPQISGAHMCTVRFLDQKIVSSCVSIAVHSNDPVRVIGSMGKEKGKLMYPCSLKIDADDNIYVVDEGNQRIQKMFPDGYVEIISVAGSSKNARTFDCALDTEHDELICSKVIVDQRKAWAETIQIFSLDGNLKHQFTNPDMKKALYVAVNSKQHIIVTDYHLNKLFIYDHSGKMLNAVGEHGSGEREFKEPAFVCIGKNDDIIVSDCRNSRVQVLDKDGTFKYQIGNKGSGKGQLLGPSGIAIDDFGHILVTDRVNNRIQIYTYEGKFISCIESSGNKLNDPRGLAVANGYVYVADQKNHCVKKYKYM